MNRPTNRPLLAAATIAFTLLVAACSGTPSGAPTVTLTPQMSHGPASLGPRPPSDATIEILEPAQGDTVVGASAHVVLKLNGAVIVTETTTDIRPDEGHVHLYINNQIISMNYGLEQDVPVVPGAVALKAEFVAADHAPYNPRVWSDEIVFTVR
ncbi:MAG TPA: hypothetical protein VMQ65_10840 [Candidatus Limnocylindria bacterium]|nr:hypothetical protein [Candidatus Limnocylindria bacterium]